MNNERLTQIKDRIAQTDFRSPQIYLYSEDLKWCLSQLETKDQMLEERSGMIAALEKTMKIVGEQLQGVALEIAALELENANLKAKVLELTVNPPDVAVSESVESPSPPDA